WPALCRLTPRSRRPSIDVRHDQRRAVLADPAGRATSLMDQTTELVHAIGGCVILGLHGFRSVAGEKHRVELVHSGDQRLTLGGQGLHLLGGFLVHGSYLRCCCFRLAWGVY